MPKVNIDGQEIEVAPGTTILQAALTRGREIPHFCYHPGLSIAGNCRICLVEVEKAPKLLIACQTPVQDGMVVRTASDQVKEAQNAVMEFLLINHPLDCPICDQAGECRLQDNAVEYGSGKSRYTEPKLALAKAVDIGKHILLDQERCIQCSRCIRFCDEITGTGELAFFQRGERTIIGIYPGKRLDNPYSGNTVDICPVGALTLKEFRFKTRVWYLKNTPTICVGCARGCNVVVATGTQREQMTTSGQQDDRIKRIVPRVNMEVNTHWICDEGRLSWMRVDAAARLSRPEAPAGSATDYDAALRRAAELVQQAGSLAVLVSPRLTAETLYAWKHALGHLGSPRFAISRLERGEDDALLIRKDKGANTLGAAWILGTAAADLPADVDTLIVLGDVLDPDDTPTLPQPTPARHVVYVGPFHDAAAKAAEVLLPATAWAEEDGTVVNFEGRVQQVRRAHRPPGEARPAWRVAIDLLAATGADAPPWTTAADVLGALAAEVDAFAGLTPDKIGLLGVRGGAREAAT